MNKEIIKIIKNRELKLSDAEDGSKSERDDVTY